MTRSRKIIAVTLVAAALCADRAVSAAPALANPIRTEVANAAGKLVSRLSVSFRRVVPSVRVYETRHEGMSATSEIATDIQSAPFADLRLSPLLLHLPPPTL
jgi:predicted solute-binding protein